jgi:mannosyl-3-phosphoglycerate phosphatase family protein
MKKLLIFTDLDETLLERHTYSFEAARPALEFLKEKDVPLVIVSSKTKAEIERYRSRLGNDHPFIAENGGGIFIPEGYFEDYAGLKPEREEGYDVITLGTPYGRLRGALVEIRNEGFNARGFGDMNAEEISTLTGLSTEEASLSMQRHFDEPFICDGCDIDSLRESVIGKGFNLTEGRLYHLIGDNDKGKAVEALKTLYRAKYGEISTAALGDSPTDISMLRSVDYPIAVQKDDGSYDERISMPNLIRAKGIGPAGWNASVTELVNSLLG